jgi:outer membrane protein OmpA-like peptidoglycan-associated protein
MYARVSKYLSRFFALAFVVLIPVALAAQVTASPTQKAPMYDSASKWDIFLGYSALIPNARINGYGYASIDYGVIGSVTRYFNKNVGLQFEGDEHILLPESNVYGRTVSQPGDDFSGGSVGVVYRIPRGNITPFFHALIGVEQAGSYYQTDVWGPVVTAGGGLDYNTPWFNHHLAIRLFQGDYQYLHVNFAPAQGGSTSFNPQGRISAGLVFSSGSFAPPEPVTLVCSASPASVYAGDPVTLTATAGGLNPKMNVVYTWSGSGVSGNGTTVTVVTAALAPGSYTVNCGVKEGRPGREGLKPWETADASTSFTVRAFEPPTISCSANPGTIKPGETSNITAAGVSPQNRPLTYSYTATSGSVNSSGAAAVFSSTGAPTGPVGITCTVTDDKGLTATANTSVTILAPYVASAPHSQALCSISFVTDKQRPERVDNEAKACLDGIALQLQQNPDAKLVVVGEADAKEQARTAREAAFAQNHKHAKVVDLAAERAVNTKEYLVTEKGIDASRVGVVTGQADGQTVEDYLVPSGASFTADVQGTTPVDESEVKAQVRKPLGATAHKKAAAKPAVE